MGGAIQQVTSYLGVAAKLSVQSIMFWYLLIGVIGILIFTFVPEIYGHIIEWLYLNFILKNREVSALRMDPILLM